MNIHFHVNTPQGTFHITPDELEYFEKLIGIHRVIPGRYSRAFLADLYCHNKIFGICPEEVIDAIREEESGKKLLGTKKSTLFKKEPLKGLWHKHYYSARFIGMNLANEMANGKLERIVNDIFEPHMGKPAKKEMFEELAKRVVIDSLDTRSKKQKITGEWIVFAKYQEKNYYLCMATHDNGDLAIRHKIDLICRKEFPFLDQVLAPRLE
ncbi:hypothetical protein [Aeromonas enteropelogenes]|uniref:hypothetical protein n=1 Tax=Aeromonas enteropelogenes TaxID=29489 RepID=UPI003BA093A1